MWPTPHIVRLRCVLEPMHAAPFGKTKSNSPTSLKYLAISPSGNVGYLSVEQKRGGAIASPDHQKRGQGRPPRGHACACVVPYLQPTPNRPHRRRPGRNSKAQPLHPRTHAPHPLPSLLIDADQFLAWTRSRPVARTVHCDAMTLWHCATDSLQRMPLFGTWESVSGGASVKVELECRCL